MSARGLAALAAVALLAPGCALHRVYREPLPQQAERVETTTQDGWRLSLTLYRAADRTGVPVLLCPGVFNNGRVLDIDAEHSLARWLAAHGRDVYVLDPRGTGFSDQPDERAGRAASYSADTYVRQDLPAAVKRIRERSGAASVDLVGHSMGGHLVYMYLARGGEGANAAVSLGAAVRFQAVGGSERESMRRIADLATSLGPTVPAPEVVHVLSPLHGKVQGPLERFGRNSENVSEATWKKFMATAVDHTSREVIRQLALWIERDAVTSADGTTDYNQLLPRVRAPVLVVAGKLDKIAPVPWVKAGYELLGGPKQLLIAGQENGMSHDYAHGDLVMADLAPVELWPRILAFLDAHAPEPQAWKTAARR